jgi:hypothetical protein
MTITLDARNLSLKDVQSLLKLTEQLNDSFTGLLSLTNLTEFEYQKLQIVRNYTMNTTQRVKSLKDK